MPAKSTIERTLGSRLLRVGTDDGIGPSADSVSGITMQSFGGACGKNQVSRGARTIWRFCFGRML
jgi:hypothetical protein